MFFNFKTLQSNPWGSWATLRDDPIYFVRFELPLIPLIDWNIEVLHKCHYYIDLYQLLLKSKSILVALFWTPYFFLSALVAFFGLSCPLQSWKHQHTNEKCYQNNILCLVNKNYDFFVTFWLILSQIIKSKLMHCQCYSLGFSLHHFEIANWIDLAFFNSNQI